MPPRSAVARLQQITSLALVSLALAWLLWSWEISALLAAAGLALMALGYVLVFGLEFLFQRRASLTDPTPRPSDRELLRAWGREMLMAPRVFCWRQPFRWRAVSDCLDPALRGRTGVVFVHGFLANRGFWTPWLDRLREAGYAFVAVNLEPVFGSIDDYVGIIDDAVRRVTETTGCRPVLVCHSMGGLAARAWLRAEGASERVRHVVTIGTPHRGTWLARFSRVTNGRQMRVDSAWMAGLPPVPQRVPFTCWYSNCDNVVFPPSMATLPGADNRLVRGAAHVEMAFQAEVVGHCLTLLARQGDMSQEFPSRFTVADPGSGR